MEGARTLRPGTIPPEGASHTLEVVGAGFGRTGTFSLKLALERLGFGPCYHMFEVNTHPEHKDLWLWLAEGGDHDWDEIFDGYRSAVDWPVAAFYEPLMHRYPGSKVVLTMRDPEDWYRSAQATIMPSAERYEEQTSPMTRRIIWEGTFSGRVHDKEHALAVYRRHVAEVQERVPPERLLMYDVRDGWGPLCAFLEVPVPPDPYPHRNTTREFQARDP